MAERTTATRDCSNSSHNDRTRRFISSSYLLIVGCLATGDAFTTVSIKTLISKSSTEETQGENLGFAQSGDGLARAIGPVIAGWLYSSYGYWVPFVAGGVTMIPVSVIAVHLSNGCETRSADTMTK